ncbi:hypothetical protein EVG20_g8517 [Dentipellis fragilis]|uniref:Uncharacterized protein n=1 Tax=Dentipellis fragilis TaxID=205917 RepID=A0A4Y9Y9I9_9AGAM|nr:hypothetical protein EVG20_g8517 [Dentipellis fragilis]
MATDPPSKATKAQKAREQKIASRQRKEQFLSDVQAHRDIFKGAVSTLAENHHKDEKVVAAHLYASSRLVKPTRKPNLYNAVLHAKALERKAKGIGSEGKDTLKNLSAEVANTDWRDLTDEQCTALLDGLAADKQQKELKENQRDLSAANRVRTFERTTNALETELVTLSAQTGCEYLSFFVGSKVTDGIAARILSSPGIRDACIQLFKDTPENMVLRIQAYIQGGLSGVVRVTEGARTYTTLKAEVRREILEGLRDILKTERAYREQDLPTVMSYKQYDGLVCTYGVQIVGWTEAGGVTNPDELGHVFKLERLLGALKKKTCCWEVLSDEEWNAKRDARAAANAANLLKRRKERIDKGKSKKKLVKSRELVDSSEDEAETDVASGIGAGSGPFANEPAGDSVMDGVVDA